MITVHHLNNSRSQRVLWLLEELGVEYEIKRYQRDAKTMLAPPELKAIHPLGKSPVLTEDGATIAESGAIIEYLIDKHGGGRFMPAPGTPERRRYTYWLHYAEGSAMPPLLLSLIFAKMPKAPMPFFVRPVVKGVASKAMKSFVGPQLKLHMDFIESELGKSTWFAGGEFTGADIQMSFPVEAAAVRANKETPRPNMQAFLDRIHARPAYQRALEKGGPFELMSLRVLPVEARGSSLVLRTRARAGYEARCSVTRSGTIEPAHGNPRMPMPDASSPGFSGSPGPSPASERSGAPRAHDAGAHDAGARGTEARAGYDIEEVNHALVEAAGRPRTVLDVGCGTGVNGAVLKARGAHVTGIELNAAAARIARNRLDRVLELDITDGASLDELGEGRFDLIVFGDVLEHMADPLPVLTRFVERLEDGGHMIVSLPNVAAWPIRLRLLRGDFTYEASGILDRTHLRFFTRDTAARLVEDAGLEVLRLEQNPMLTRAARDVIRPWLGASPPGPLADPLDGSKGGTPGDADGSTGGPPGDGEEKRNEGETGKTAGSPGPISLNELPSYRAYQRFVRPVEAAIAHLAPGALSFQNVVVARRRPVKRSLSLTVGMLSYNEEGTMGAMIDDIRRIAPDAEILVVDSSSDRTPEIAREKGATVLRQLPPQGHGPAMELLMTEAAKRTDALIYLDCDFTYPVEHITRMRQLLEEGADLVNGCRTRTRPEAMPLQNFLANRFFAATVRLVNGVPTHDVHSGMRAYRSSMIRAFSFDGSGDALPLDTLIAPARSGYRVIEYPIPYNERVGVSKLQKIRGTVWTFIRVARAIGAGHKPDKYDVRER